MTEAGKELAALLEGLPVLHQWVFMELIAKIEAEAVRDWLQSPEAEKALAAALSSVGLGGVEVRGQPHGIGRAVAILSALRESA